MTMKLKTILLLLATLTLVSLTSCSSGSGSSDPIVGEWQVTTDGTSTGLTSMYFEFGSKDALSEFSPINSVMRLKNGTYVHKDESVVITYTDTQETVTGTASFSDNDTKLTLTIASKKYVMLKKQIPQTVRDEAKYGKVNGEWKLSKMGDSSADKIEVYLEFLDGGKCNVFQNVGSSDISVYPGTYTYEKGVLSGSYTDGAAWMGNYSVKLDYECENMTLTLNGESMVYTRSEIPQSFRDNAVTKAPVRSKRPL